jgi:O-succinylbenzoic acid--CoA ligase
VLVDEAGDHEPLPNALPTEVGDALVVATSGTTGDPKGVVLTHDAVLAAATATSGRLRVDADRDRWLAMLPVAHAGGLGVVTRAILTGTPLTFDRDDPAATLVSVVPTQLERDTIGVGIGIDRFRVILVGGSADWRDRASNVVHTYGMTETGGGVVYDGAPLDGVDVRVDASTNEVFVRGPMLLRAYRGDGLDPKDGDGWLATGDAGEIDAEGLLTVRGRMGDVIVTGGEKVWPAAVEAVLARVPGVAEIAVAGRKDPTWGERVVAFVVPRDPANPPTLVELKNAVLQGLPPYAAPKELVLRQALPRAAQGKLRRGQLG